MSQLSNYVFVDNAPSVENNIGFEISKNTGFKVTPIANGFSITIPLTLYQKITARVSCGVYSVIRISDTYIEDPLSDEIQAVSLNGEPYKYTFRGIKYSGEIAAKRYVTSVSEDNWTIMSADSEGRLHETKMGPFQDTVRMSMACLPQHMGIIGAQYIDRFIFQFISPLLPRIINHQSPHCIERQTYSYGGNLQWYTSFVGTYWQCCKEVLALQDAEPRIALGYNCMMVEQEKGSQYHANSYSNADIIKSLRDRKEVCNVISQIVIQNKLPAGDPVWMCQMLSEYVGIADVKGKEGVHYYSYD